MAGRGFGAAFIMRFLPAIGGKIEGFYGVMTAPYHRGVSWGVSNGLPFGVDLGCLEGPDFVKKIDFDEVFKWFPQMEPFKKNCLFLAGGDVVYDAAATLETYAEFKPYFGDWPLAYVAQNGAEDLPIPEDCAAIFIGGDTEWKCSPMAEAVIKRGLAMEKHIHIGRVNWHQRYKVFRFIEGSDSFTCDGTRTRYEATKALAAWKSYEKQQPLFYLPME